MSLLLVSFSQCLLSFKIAEGKKGGHSGGLQALFLVKILQVELFLLAYSISHEEDQHGYIDKHPFLSVFFFF